MLKRVFVCLAIICIFAFPARATETAFEQYKPNYFVFEWADERSEPWVQFQVSYRYSMVRGDYVPKWLTFIPPGKFTIAYSQISYWPVFEPSSPFDEHDFNPEGYYDAGWFKAGYEHQSTGVAGDDSRSWDRAFVELTRTAGRLELSLRAWYILDTDSDTESIRDIMSFGVFGGSGEIAVTSGQWYRHSLQATRGNLIAGMGFRVRRNSNIYWFARGFVGRGYSLVRFREEMSTVSMGMALIR